MSQGASVMVQCSSTTFAWLQYGTCEMKTPFISRTDVQVVDSLCGGVLERNEQRANEQGERVDILLGSLTLIRCASRCSTWRMGYRYLQTLRALG